MRIVNKRYEIKNNIKNFNAISEYKVLDKVKNKEFKLTILSDYAIDKSTIRYISNNFKSIKNFNFEGIYETYELISIKEIDGIRLEKIKHGFISEISKNEVDIKEYLRIVDEEKILLVIFDILAIVNTLMLKGFSYSNLTLDDIKINCEDGIGTVKLPNIITSEFGKLDGIILSCNNIENLGKKDIYNDGRINLDYLIKIIQDIVEISVHDKFYKLKEIEIILNNINKNKVQDINTLIEYLNRKISSKNKKFIMKNIQKIEEHIDIVGRDVELDNILKTYRDIAKGKSSSKAILLDGGMGVGKTRLLKEVKSRLEYNYITNIFSIFKIKNEVKLRWNKCAKEYNYSNGFRLELEKFTDDFSEKIKKRYNLSFTEDIKEMYKTINSGLKIIDEHSRIAPMVLIIDDLDKRNKICRNFFKHLIENLRTLENILIIASLDRSLEDEEFKEYYEEISYNQNIKEYKIEMLNKYYTCEMTRKVLNTSNDITEIVEVIYNDTLGNPNLIMKKIKDMYLYKSIYVSKNGIWKYRYVYMIFNSISYLEEKYIDKIEKLSFFEYSVLKKLAVYNFTIREDIFLKKSIVTLKEKEAYAELKIKNVLIESYDDNGINVDFKDCFYKKIIYKKMNRRDKFSEHLNFIKILKEICDKEERLYNELIYHLEMGKEYDQMIIYAKKYANKMNKIGENEKTISIYKRIFNYLGDGEMLEISYEIGNIYARTESDSKALGYYKKANEKAITLRNYSYIIETSLNIARIHIENENHTEAFENINIARINLLKTEYKLGYAKYFLIKALYLKYAENKEEAIEFANRALNIAKKENYFGLIGEIYLILFSYSIQEGDFILAEEYVSYCEKVFKEGISGKKYYENLLNRGILYIERDKDVEKGKQVLIKVLKASRKYKIASLEYNALIQLANIYAYLDRFEVSKKYLLISLEVIKSGKNLKRYLNSTYEYLIYVSAIQRDICELIKYKNILLEIDKTSGNELLYGLYYYALGDYEKLKYKINKLSDENIKSIIDKKPYLKIKTNFINILLLKNINNIYEEITYIEQISRESYNTKAYDNKMISLILLLNDLGYTDLARKVFNNIKYKISFTKLDEVINLKITNKFKSYSINALINQGLRLINDMKNDMNKVELYYIIGENFEKNNCYSLAFENYYEGLSILSSYIRKEKSEDKIKIVSSKIFCKIFEKIIFCANEKLNLNLDITTMIKNNEDIDKLLNEIKVSNMMKNNKFKEIVIEKYEKSYLNKIQDAESVLVNFKENIIYNIETIMKFIIRETLSTSAILIMKNGRKNEVIYSYRINYENIKDRLLSKKINVDFFVVDNEEMIQNEIYNEIFQNRTKACFYKKLSSKYTEEKINNPLDIELVLVSDKIINNINYESYEKIKKYENVIIFLLEQYKLNISSTRDKLTGAYNRRYFEKTMNNIIMNYNYTENIFSLIIFDIDNFKGVNDKFGHQTGDIVLEKISSIVLEEIEIKDIFSRYGGEEFVIICPGKNSEEAYEKADNIRKKIQEADILRGRREVTISMGISEYPKHSKKKEELISKADQALYKAKRGTKNIVKIWDETFDIKIEVSDRLAGIMTGNASKDYERISSIVKIIEIIKKDIRNEFKLYDILTKILKLTESRECMLFKINNNNEIICEMAIREREQGWKNVKYFNRNLIDNVFKEGNGLYDIDWDEVVNENKTMPKWNSICIVPIVNEDEVKGAIYMSVPLKRKEFDFKDYNYVNTIGNILSILF